MGHLAFYEDNRAAEKLSTDSIFVLSRGRTNKYEYVVMNSRLGGQLRCSAPSARSKYSHDVLQDMCKKLGLPLDTPRKQILRAWVEILHSTETQTSCSVHGKVLC